MRTADAFRIDLEQHSDDPLRCSASLKRLADDLNRCLEWLRRGAVREAAAYNVDAGNIVALALDLHQHAPWASALASAGVPSAEDLDRLARAHAAAGAHGAAVQAWQNACVSSASIRERLNALHDLRACEPTDTQWTSILDDLSSEALTTWSPRAQAALGANDPDAMRTIRSALIEVGVVSDAGRRLLQQLDDAIEGCTMHEHALELERIAHAMHMAWAAMDVAVAKANRPLLQRLLPKVDDAIAARLDLGPVLAWLNRCDEAQAVQAQRESGIDDLRRALDEDREIAEIERRYAAIRGTPGRIDAVLESRVAHRFQTHRRRQRRVFALGITIILALAVALTAAVTIATGNARHQARVRDLANRIEAELAHGRIPSARATWQEGVEAELATEPLLAAVHQKVESAAAAYAARQQQVGETIDEALELMDASPVTLEALEQVAALLSRAREEAGSPLPPAILQIDDRRRDMLTSLLTEERARIQSALEQLDETLTAPAPTGSARLDSEAWTRWSESAEQARESIHDLRTSRVAGDADIAAWMDRVDELAQSRTDRAAQRIAAIDEIARLMQQLSRTPSGERAWADAWKNLVDSHIGLLQIALPREEWQDAREAAQVARAVAHWRDTVRPALVVAGHGRGLLPTTPSDGAEVMTVLASHHTSYPGSPYAVIASTLTDIARQTRQGTPADRTSAMLVASGLLDLYTVELNNGGMAYIRVPDSSVLRVIDTREALHLDPSHLDDSALGRNVGPQASPRPALASAALAAGIEAITDDEPRIALEQSLMLAQGVEASGEQDPLLKLEALALAWRTIVETQGATAPEGLQIVQTWLDDLPQTASGALSADWPRLARAADPTPHRSLQRQASRGLMTAPAVSAVRGAIQAEFRLQDARAAARAPAAVLLADDDEARVRDRQVPTNTALELIHPNGDGWIFMPVTVDADDAVTSDLSRLPRAPMILFAR